MERWQHGGRETPAETARRVGDPLFLDEHRRLRDRALFDLAIDSKLRGCDIVKMKIGDIVVSGAIRNRATVIQQKTRRPVQFELMAEARKTLLTWLNRRGGSIDDFIFPSRVNYMGHLSTRQYARLVTSGSVQSASTYRNTAHTRCVERRLRSSTKRLATFALCKSCSVILTLRIPYDTSALTLMTRLLFLSARKFERNGSSGWRGAVPNQMNLWQP